MEMDGLKGGGMDAMNFMISCTENKKIRKRR